MKPNANENKNDFLARCTRSKVSEGVNDKDAFQACNLDWARDKGEAMSLAAPITLAAAEEDSGKKRFLISAYTGKPVERWGESLVISVEGMETKNKMPVLREHARDRVVGFGDTWKDKTNLFVSGEFTESTVDGREVRALAEEGYPWQASISVMPLERVYLKDKMAKRMVDGRELVGPMEIWLRSSVGEVSFVSLGADDRTAAIAYSEPLRVNAKVEPFQSEKMLDTIKSIQAIMTKPSMNPAPVSDFAEKAASLATKRGIKISVAMQILRARDPNGFENYLAAANGQPPVHPAALKHPFILLTEQIADQKNIKQSAAMFEARQKNQNLYNDWIVSVQRKGA